MKVFPKNKHLLVEILEDEKEDNGILLPEDYKVIKDYVVAKVLSVHPSVSEEIQEGSTVVAEANMLRKVEVLGQEHYSATLGGAQRNVCFSPNNMVKKEKLKKLLRLFRLEVLSPLVVLIVPLLLFVWTMKNSEFVYENITRALVFYAGVIQEFGRILSHALECIVIRG